MATSAKELERQAQREKEGTESQVTQHAAYYDNRAFA